MKPKSLALKFITALVIAAFLLAALPAPSAQAAITGWYPLSLDSVGCGSGDTYFTMQLSGITLPNNYYFQTIVDAGTNRYMDETFLNSGLTDGTYTWSLYYSNEGGTATNLWPMPANTPIHVTFRITDGLLGPTVLIHEIEITQCNGGVMVPLVSWVPISLDTTGCNSGDTRFTMLLNGVSWPNNYWMMTWVDVNGVRFMDEHFASWFGTNGIYTWGLYNMNSGGSATGTWPLPANTPVHINFIITDGQYGPTVSRYTAHMTQCNGGTLITEFNDVSHFYYESLGGIDYALFPYVAALFNAGMTSGTSSNPPLYSPTTILNRAMAAVFMLRANYGIAYTPPLPPYPTFAADNWTLNSWAQPWAQGMWNAHLTAGCQTSPLMYCPDRILTREEAVVFALHMKYDYFDAWNNLVSYTPPPATGNVFADMTNPTYWSAPWAEKAYLDGIIPACGWSGGKPLFCQFDPVDRAWAAYLIVKAAGLTLPLP